MKMRINEFGPRSYPRFDHQNPPTGAEASRRLRQKTRHLGYVVEHIGHHNGAQRTALERQLPGIEDDVYFWAAEDLGSDQIGHEARTVTGARANFKHWPLGLCGKVCRKQGVPLVVNCHQEWL